MIATIDEFSLELVLKATARLIAAFGGARILHVHHAHVGNTLRAPCTRATRDAFKTRS